MTAPDETVTIHSRPTDEAVWSSSVSYDTLAALIDKLGEGERLYFTSRQTECYVLALRPKTARLMVSERAAHVDFQGHRRKSRGRLVVDELRGRDGLRRHTTENFQLVQIDLIPADQAVTPSARLNVRSTRCGRCGGSGREVLFNVPRDCEPCGGTGWVGSSENTTETEARETPAPGSEKGTT